MKYRLRAIVRRSTDIQRIERLRFPVEIAVGDLDDALFLDQAMQGVHTLLHIAGIQCSLNVVKAALNNGVKRLILVHTTGIYSKYKEAGKEYLQIEAQIEALLAGKELSLTILRPTMIYGTLNDGNISVFVRMVDKLRLFPVVDGGRFALQPVHHRDLGMAYYQVLMNPQATANKDYVLSGRDVLDLIDILKAIALYLDKKTHFISVPFALSYLGAKALYGLSFKRVDLREKVQRLVEPRAYAHEQAALDFGYAPLPFLDGLKQEVDLYLEQKKAKTG